VPREINEGIVLECVYIFNSGRTNIHDEERSVNPSLVTDELVWKIDTKVCENQGFIISEFSYEYSQIYSIVFYEVVTDSLNYRKYYAR